MFFGIVLSADIIKTHCGKKTSGYTADIKDVMAADAVTSIGWGKWKIMRD